MYIFVQLIHVFYVYLCTYTIHISPAEEIDLRFATAVSGFKGFRQEDGILLSDKMYLELAAMRTVDQGSYKVCG